MQVKRFEARTMKEALEMVKKQLGPEAIILSAKDNRNRFGLVGEGSVEITAAVSEETLRRKQFAESKMNAKVRDQFQNSPARTQKKVMDDFVRKHQESQTEESYSPRSQTQVRYVDIDAPPEPAQVAVARAAAAKPAGPKPTSVKSGLTPPVQIPQSALALAAREQELSSENEDEQSHPIAPNSLAASRIRSAAARAWGAFRDTQGEERASAPQASSTTPPAADSTEISTLKNEILELKSLISNFQRMPEILQGNFPGADLGVQFSGSRIFERMTREGVDREVSAEIIRTLQSQLSPEKAKDSSVLEGLIIRYLLQTIRIAPKEKDKRIQLFVGPAGSGKTSMLVKTASHYLIKEKKKVALVTTDYKRIGAPEQLRIYAQILNVPFAIVRQEKDWLALSKALEGYDHILCDFPGSHLRDKDEVAELRSLFPPQRELCQTHLVLRLNSRNEELKDLVSRYSNIFVTDVCLNGLDEAISHGVILNLLNKYEIPIRAFGTGARVPEDYESASAERVVDLIFHLSSQYQAQEKQA